MMRIGIDGAELYKAHKEAGSIYFFNQREFSGSARVRPGRTAKDGWWKASGGGMPLKRRGLVVGYKLTLVFYEKKPGDKADDKTDWIIKEYTIVGPNKKVISHHPSLCSVHVFFSAGMFCSWLNAILV